MTLSHVITHKKSQNVLNKFTILCWATFVAVLGYMWPMGHWLDTPGLRELQDNMKCNNICNIGMPEGEEKEQGVESLSDKIITENFPNLVRGKFTQV